MTKKSFLLKLGRHIAKLREQKGLNQANLARKSGKDPQSLYRLENGIVNPSIFYLKEIADELEMTVSEILDFEY